MNLATQARWSLAAAALGAASLAMADNPVIQDIAPKDSFLVVSIPSWPSAKTAFMRSPAGSLWQDRTMQDWLEKLWKEMRSEAGSDELVLLDDLKDRMEAIGEPTGTFGLAMSVAKPAPAAGAPDETPPGMTAPLLVMADFGEGAAKAEAAIVEFLEEQAKKDRLSLSIVTVAGIEAHEIELKVDDDDTDADGDGADDPADDPEDVDDMDDMDELGDMNEPDFGSLFGSGGPVKMFLARAGGAIVLASQKDGLEHALDRLAGRNRPHLAESADWNGALAQHPRGGHFFAAAFLNDSVREAIRGAGDDLSGAVPLPLEEMGIGFEKIFATLGLAPIRAVSIAARLDAEVAGAAAMEQTIGILLPEKTGLFTLIEGEASPLDPPSWVGSDVAGVGRFNIRFERIVPLLEQIVKTLPPDIQNLASGGVQFVKTSFGPALDVMGPEMYLVDTISRPLSATSQARVGAIKVRDELTVANAASGVSAQAGLEARDFQGAQIYESPDKTFAAGLGFGWLFLGEPAGVENAMRRAANPGEAGQPLAANERFRRAMSAVNASGQGLLQSWTDDHQTIDYAMWTAQNPKALMRAEWEKMGMAPAEVDEIVEGMEEVTPAWLKDLPPPELFKRYVDSSSFSMRSTPDGFRATYLTLPPRKP